MANPVYHDDESEPKTDPSANTWAIVASAVKRLDDVMRVSFCRVEDQILAERRRVDEQLALREEYDLQLSIAEAKRIDALRTFDVNAVAVANERAMAQAAVLANQVAASAETLRALVSSTATAVAQQLAQISAQLSDRISLLEKSQYESRGTSGGMRDMWGWVFGIGLGVAGLVSIVYTMFSK